MRIRDPRTPDVLVWRDGLDPVERLTMLVGMSYAFAFLTETPDWKARIGAAMAEARPSAEEFQAIIEAAGRVSGQLYEELGHGG